MKNEELIFSDYETNAGKKEYSRVGGCYYTAKMAVLDYLLKIKKQFQVSNKIESKLQKLFHIHLSHTYA